LRVLAVRGDMKEGIVPEDIARTRTFYLNRIWENLMTYEPVSREEIQLFS